MSPTPRGKPPSDAAEEPGRRGDERRSGPAGEGLVPRPRSWREWVRTQPLLAGAVLAFCLVAIGGLMLSLPSGIAPGDRSRRVVEDEGRESAPPAARPPEREAPAQVPWTVQPASASST